jgi:hypothetical protein
VRLSGFYRHVVSAETNCLQPASARFLLGLLFRHENGGSISSEMSSSLRTTRSYELEDRIP